MHLLVKLHKFSTYHTRKWGCELLKCSSAAFSPIFSISINYFKIYINIKFYNMLPHNMFSIQIVRWTTAMYNFAKHQKMNKKPRDRECLTRMLWILSTALSLVLYPNEWYIHWRICFWNLNPRKSPQNIQLFHYSPKLYQGSFYDFFLHNF